ncbi:MAG: hypothetical protein HYS13_18080 [Planctomycetia bacterium]|nr:hypothetical protein [Planctomycetia bacterium]
MPRKRDKERAKRIIVEIVRQAGGRFAQKTNLFKAFWKAHVEYARKHVMPLSNWPIVRMPKGPGIDRFNELLGELISQGIIEPEERIIGGNPAFVFNLADSSAYEGELNADERKAIKKGVAAVVNKSASKVSKASHRQSRAWEKAKDGDQLDLVLDTIPEREFRERNRRLAELNKVADKFFRSRTS